jgi:hypothetical protein
MLSPQEDSYTPSGGVIFTARVQFLGSDLVNGPDASTVIFTVEPGDTPVVIRDKIAAAILAEATRLGYTLGNNAILMPSYVKA